MGSGLMGLPVMMESSVMVRIPVCGVPVQAVEIPALRRSAIPVRRQPTVALILQVPPAEVSKARPALTQIPVMERVSVYQTTLLEVVPVPMTAISVQPINVMD